MGEGQDRSGIPRRTVVQAAWAAPVVLAVAAAPAAAASTTASVTLEVLLVGDDLQFTIDTYVSPGVHLGGPYTVWYNDGGAESPLVSGDTSPAGTTVTSYPAAWFSAGTLFWATATVNGEAVTSPVVPRP
ncbi:hypothetical protein N1031_06200 [Herbiconiux moechotypicola]|uniref:Uncharacterized protein n=1 Tax=Herbiconiux moechotypicola TaxID=637393 RepID=A0ABN3DET2_9MICO|nr:hypothetical protein [Herbiconiux moechotypicola]MCS5729348.1 hypothetical protein [Herbiconiux moechotypicola]